VLDFVVKDSLESLFGAEAAALFFSWKSKKSDESFIIITPSDQYARRLSETLSVYFEELEKERILDQVNDNPDVIPSVVFFPSWDTLPFEERSPEILTTGERIRALHTLSSRTEKELHSILVCSVPAVSQKVISPDRFRRQTWDIQQGDTCQSSEMIESLEWLGYRRARQVEEVGQYSVKGSVIDFFSPSRNEPVRVQFFTSVIDSIRVFNCDTQRSFEDVSRASILPVREFGFSYTGAVNEIHELILPNLRVLGEACNVSSSTLRMYEEKIRQGLIWDGAESCSNYLFRDGVSLMSYLGEKIALFFSGDVSIEPYLSSWEETLRSQYEYQKEHGNFLPERKTVYFDKSELAVLVTSKTSILRTNEAFTFSPAADFLQDKSHLKKRIFEAAPLLQSKVKNISEKQEIFEQIAKHLKQMLKDGYYIIMSFPSDEKLLRIKELFDERGVKGQFSSLSLTSLLTRIDLSRIYYVVSSLSEGCIDHNGRLAVFTERELFSRLHQQAVHKTRFKRSRYRRVMSSLSQLEVDDYVVHEQYGIGKFLGLKALSLQGVFGEFLDIEYAGKSKLYVPVQDFSKVGKYSSSDGAAPSLTKLGSGSWEKLRAKVKKSIAELTGMLLKTMAVRSLSKGFDFGPQSNEDEWFAGLFPFDETPDQKRTIEEVLSDMASERPMDRLVCGDVGYGKTEVAMRAAFKATLAGKQVAILVPTTILADQHYRTFQERFTPTPVSVGVLSRFVTRMDQQRVVSDLMDGSLDIIIGTHRLLQSDIIFKDLGLVIIDEEHRFGVAHKERLKRLRAEVDVLSLSATPIPRTLQMALFGTRDLSVIETPPVDRQVVHTEVLAYDEDLFDMAIRRELARGGQVFVVHHFIEGLEEIAAEIRTRIPEAKVAMVHGRLSKNELEERMHDFYSGACNVLVATSIIESGLDIPNANTMLIIKSEQFGLAQLYQLRGRVGRSSKKGFAYLFHSHASSLTPDAKRRLRAIGSMDEMGIGYRLAIQDMEIRGAGSLLGKDQSGNVQQLGYDMYVKVLEDAVESEKMRRGLEDGSEKESTFPEFEPEVVLGLDACIPEDFIPDMNERLVMYQRTSGLCFEEEVVEFYEDLEDRFGGIPDEIKSLVLLMRIRNLCKKTGIHRCSLYHGMVSFALVPVIDNNTDPRAGFFKERNYSMVPKSSTFRIACKGEADLQVQEILHELNELVTLLGLE
jgi:transcription-repair coupling factor (superfamily II helicase)